MENLGQGLALSLTGLLITFAALGALIGLIVALEWVFRPRPAPVPDEAAAPIAPTPAGDLEEVAAAIAVALSHWRQAEAPRGELGGALAQGPGPWWRPGDAGESSGVHTR
jgi:Na+-transporting methylmalonyl-CoA/oxaloacetate decarboxylase gamma subunit